MWKDDEKINGQNTAIAESAVLFILYILKKYVCFKKILN